MNLITMAPHFIAGWSALMHTVSLTVLKYSPLSRKMVSSYAIILIAEYSLDFAMIAV